MSGVSSASVKGWEGFRRLPLAGQIVIGFLAAVAVFELLQALASPLGGGSQGGPSSYSTKSGGLAAYAELLEDQGHRVERTTDTLDDADLPSGSTLFVARTKLADDEVEPVRQFVADGGRLVLAGRQPEDVERRILDGEPEWGTAEEPAARSLVPVPESVGIDDVVFEPGSDVLEDPGPALPVIGNAEGAVVAVADYGRGRIVILSAPGSLDNSYLASGDNAAMGLALVGPPERPVYFAEAGHRGTGTGLRAIPDNWKWALVAGLLATLLAMWSSARRFGPPEDEARDLPPPRKAYVDAVAATLAKTNQPDAALAPLRQAARERLARRAVLPSDAGEEQLRRAAAEAGLPPDEIDALFGAVTGDDKALAVARAMARLGGPEW